MQTIGDATREVWQFQAASELQDAIVGREPPDKLDKLESICGCSIERFFSTLTQLFLCTLSGYAPAGGAVKDCPGVYQRGERHPEQLGRAAHPAQLGQEDPVGRA
jgi:hypothetical protein